jgi:hypothetical protein
MKYFYCKYNTVVEAIIFVLNEVGKNSSEYEDRKRFIKYKNLFQSKITSVIFQSFIKTNLIIQS